MMNIIIFGTFLFFSLTLLGYAFYNKKVIYLAAITSFLLMLLGASILTGGITQTFVGSYGFYNNTANNSATGSITSTITYTDVYIVACGMFLVILGIMTLFLTFWYMLKGSEEAE